MTEEQILEERERLIKREEELFYEQESLQRRKKELHEEQPNFFRQEGMLIDERRQLLERTKEYDEERDRKNQQQMNMKVIYDISKMVSDIKFSYMKGEISLDQVQELRIDVINSVVNSYAGYYYDNTVEVINSIIKNLDSFIQKEQGQAKNK